MKINPAKHPSKGCFPKLEYPSKAMAFTKTITVPTLGQELQKNPAKTHQTAIPQAVQRATPKPTQLAPKRTQLPLKATAEAAAIPKRPNTVPQTPPIAPPHS